MSRTIPFMLCLSLLGCSLFLHAQRVAPKMKYGKISDEEMSMPSYAPDPAAPAVILFDKGTVTNRYDDNNGFSIEFEQHKRIKIFSKEAYGLADLAIFYYKGQKIKDLKACAYNLESGKIVETKLSDDNVFDEKLSSNYFVRKVVIPAVREGTVIEFKYSILDEGFGLPLDHWTFQHPYAPTVWSEFESSVPEFVDYKKHSQGWIPFALSEENSKDERINISYIARDESAKVTVSKAQNIQIIYGCNLMHFIQENVPALKPEPMVASASDYLSQISFDVKAVYSTQLTPMGTSYRLSNGSSKAYNRTWTGIGKSLLEDYFDDILNSGKFTASETATCIAGKTSDSEKLLAVYEFIGKNYQASDFDYMWKSQTMDKLTSNRKGTPTDLNLVFINMLRRAKVKAYPVLISTRPNGKILSWRVSAQKFDRVIAAVALNDSTLTLVDAAGWPAPIGILPALDLNSEGLLLKDKDFIDWIPLESKPANRSALMAEFEMLADGSLKGSVNFSETGHEAVNARKMMANKDALTYARERFNTLLSDGQMSDLKVEGATDWNNPGLKGSFGLQTQAYASVSGNKIYLNPLLSFGLKETPFKNPDRKFGVDFGPNSNSTYIFSYVIPAGYQVEEAPKSAKISLGENALTFDYLVDKSNPALLKITVRQNIRTSFLGNEEFPDLKQFYASMVAKMAEQVVLSK